MPIKSGIDESQINDLFTKEMERVDRVIIRTLAAAGAQAVNVARNWAQQRKPYTDQTGNLRSSTGFIILRDGEVVHISDFEVVKDGEKGRTEGASYAKSLASEFNVGYVLIVVAGMNYALYVKRRGYDVLDSAELYAENLVPKLLAQLKNLRKEE